MHSKLYRTGESAGKCGRGGKGASRGLWTQSHFLKSAERRYDPHRASYSSHNGSIYLHQARGSEERHYILATQSLENF